MIKLFPGFGKDTAHLTNPPLFPKMKSLTFTGDQFHWAPAKSPNLIELDLTRPCGILSDCAPDEVNLSLKFLTMVSRSSILNTSSSRHETLQSFLAHFPALACLDLIIRDSKYDRHTSRSDDHSHDVQGSFDVLLRILKPLAPSLKTLNIEVDRSTRGHFLDFALPTEGFKDFTCLEELVIPYKSLFGTTDPQWSHISPLPTELLPTYLNSLEIKYPRFEVYDWLARIPQFRHELPLLDIVDLSCDKDYGDSYEVFAFISYPHPVFAVLKSISIELYLHCNRFHWEAEWDNYDLKMLDNFHWFNSFGSACTGTFLPDA